MFSRGERVRKVIGGLNALQVGEIRSMAAKLSVAKEALVALDEPDLASVIQQAQEKLGSGDLSEFRRLVAQTVARLGHLR